MDVPVNSDLDRWAVQAVSSSSIETREQGIQALSHFKTRSNASRLNRLLTDPGFVVTTSAEDNKGIEVRGYPTHELAFDTLSAWGLHPSKLVVSTSVSKLTTIESLHWWGTFGESDFEILRQAKGLKSLDLSGTGFTSPQNVIAGIGARYGASINDA